MSTAVDLTRAGALGRASDAQLTSLIRQGNQEAFAALYERHKGLVNAIARASPRERAEDIAQDTWTSAYRALSRPGQPIDHAGPWLATIARNVARDRFRRDVRQREVADDDIVASAPAAGGVESALEGKHNVGRLLGAIDELPEEQRVIVNLREFGGLTYKQIAEQLGKPESTIEAALFRARRKMAKEYAELDSGRRCRTVQSQLLTGRQLSAMERRRLTRHLGRCATCERVARLEGADHLIPAPRLARIAGAIPLPAVVARVLTGGADAVGPAVGKAAVAGVAVVAAAGALFVSEHQGGAPSTGSPTVAEAAAPTAGASQAAVVLSAAPRVVRPYRVTATRKAAGGSAPATTVRPTTTAGAAPTAGATPVAPGTTKADPPRSVSTEPVRTERRPTAPQQNPAPQPTAPAPQVGQVSAPVTQAVGSGGSQATQPVEQTVAPATGPPRQQTPPAANPPAQRPTVSQGPRVTQTPTCLVADCTISP